MQDPVQPENTRPVRPETLQPYQPTDFQQTCLCISELCYMSLVKEILECGAYRKDRTGVGAWSLFGKSLSFDLRDGKMPLLTQKKMAWKSIVEELLWFLKGSTDANELSAKGVKIWDANGAKTGGDLGPVYGFQWRHFGAEYADCKTDYAGKGVDQLRYVIDKIKNSPNSRQIVMSAWNPVDIPKMALPPCHMIMQFDIAPDCTGKPRLSCMLTQRSADMGLGVPFNIASYSLLVHILAKVCGLEPGSLYHSLGNVHVYVNHVEPLRTQLAREVRPPPKIDLSAWKTEGLDPIAAIEALRYEDIKLIGYDPHPAIPMEMAL